MVNRITHSDSIEHAHAVGGSVPDQQQVTINKGHLDLREWDAEEGGILLLDGEWEFYPMQWLLDGSGQDASGGPKPKLIAVPGMESSSAW